MHMPEISDDELDALFRQGADRYPDELNLGAWARMEQQLDEARVQALVRRRVARWFAAEIGLLAVLLLLWMGYQQFSATSASRKVAVAAATGAAPLAASAPQPAGETRRAGAMVAPAAAAPATVAVPAAGAPTAAGSTDAAAPTVAAASAPPTMSPAGGPGRSRRRVKLPLALTAAPNDAPTTSATEAAATTAASPRRRTRLHGALLLAEVRQPKHQLHRTETTPRPTTSARPQAAPGSGAGLAAPTGFPAASDAPGTAGADLAGETTGTAAPAGSGAAPGAATTGGSIAAPSVTTGAEMVAPAAAGTLTTSSNGSGAPVSVETVRGKRIGKTGAAVRPAAAHDGGQSVATDDAATTAGATRRLAAPAVSSVGADSALAATPAHLLLDSLGQLPDVLPADSIVRRRPRPGMPSHIFITGVYAPEWSTVRNAGFDRVGRSVGIQVEYLLLPRLRVSIGLLSSMKYYYARPEDYTFAWPVTRPVERVRATCRITDVPVNLRYDLLQGIRYRAFVSGGLTSLLMRDEVYTYTYVNSTYTRSFQVKNGSNHPFSVVNVSAGLERQLTARWSVQAEPYVKIPLGGVGAGKVRLSSGGVFFGLKYGL